MVSTLIVLLAFAPEGGCTKDIECKGERICESGVCVNPPSSPTPTGTPTLPPATSATSATSAPAGALSGATQPVPPSSYAAGSTIDRTAHRHVGLFLRPELGFGYVSADASVPGQSVSLTAPGGAWGFAIGGAVVEDLIVAGHLFGFAGSNPSLSVNGTSNPTANAQLSFFGVGPEVDYYLAPLNLYGSLTLALTRGAFTLNGQDSNTQVGVGALAAIGKEWWVSDHWGLGGAVQFALSSNKDSSANNAPTWGSWHLSAVFSATYN